MSEAIVNQTFVIKGRGQPASQLGPDDFCSRIDYREVDACHIREYLRRSNKCGCCLPLSFFFGLSPAECVKGHYPVPTDEGLAAGLPTLPLGFHYSQTSLDRECGRAKVGVFSKERGKIWVAPWIQTTESVIVEWDGIKRSWSDGDPIDEDPLLAEALINYAMWKHNSKWDRDYQAAEVARSAYMDVRAMLIRQCREETRQRRCEPSHARAGFTNLYYNDEQSATVQCPSGSTGDSVTEIIPAGTVASLKSVSDANKIAKDQALTQAKARLDCVTNPTVFWNTPKTGTAECEQEEGAPAPTGNQVIITIDAGKYPGSTQAEADALAQAAADAAAVAALSCVYHNREKSFVAVCPSDAGITATATVPAATPSADSTESQSDADTKAQSLAETLAWEMIEGTCPEVVWNTPQRVTVSLFCTGFNPSCQVTIIVDVPENTSSGPSQDLANANAQQIGQMFAAARHHAACTDYGCTLVHYTYPNITPG